VALPPDTTHTY